MKNRIFVVVAIVVLFLVVTVGYGFSAPQPVKNAATTSQQSAAKDQAKAISASKVQTPEAKTAKPLTKEESISALKDELVGDEELISMIPGLKAETDKAGKISYTLKGVNLEDLAKEDIDSLLIRVRQTAARMRIERIQRQLETVRRTQELQRITQPPQTPRPPSTPPAPPSPPRVPSAPPAPPPSRR